MKNLTYLFVLALSLTSCNYSNTFKGTYNDAPASMSAYSGNISRYCISLTMTSGSTSKSSYISAYSLFDPNDFLKPMSFNTKGAACGQGLSEYLVGNRTTAVLNTSVVYDEERYPYNFDWCQIVYYKDYEYQESVTVDFKNNSDDQSVGIFAGTGEVSDYVDYDHPVGYGPIYYCGPNHFPYPYPHPHPHLR